ncbi:TIGR04500 family putative peptide maturation system protein [Dactylosporangium sp. NBC_01737]|uniref:TIGR04500 family putative peptide maturation system protein n=1 Tax=Dactylosporangium sp. NBC_01737 TaxID=2975959 RepID=UPI002E0ED12A|nr:TIGR04500 family putative peptide maturation system protein [Dactylosporangium sp. NBC_01737]
MTLLPEAVALLRAATAGKAGTADTRARVEALRARHPGAGLRLLWQREEYDGSLHYDLLIREPGGTVSLSWCPDDGLPWPLRGVQRGGEMLLVRVNGVALEVADAVAYLDLLWREAPLRERLVDSCLVREAVNGEELDDAGLQAAADAFRRARGLLTPEATRAWMAAEGLSDQQFEELVAHQALVARLRERVTAGAVDAEVAAGARRHDRLRLVRWSTRTPRRPGWPGPPIPLPPRSRTSPPAPGPRRRSRRSPAPTWRPRTTRRPARSSARWRSPAGSWSPWSWRSCPPPATASRAACSPNGSPSGGPPPGSSGTGVPVDEPAITRDGVFLASAVRRHAEGSRVEPVPLRVLPGRLFAALWLAAALLLTTLAVVLRATLDAVTR